MYKKLSLNSENVRGFKIKLYPTDEQKKKFQTHMNLFRFTYNWALDESKKFYQEYGTYIGKTELMKRFANLRNNTEWLQELPLHSGRLAIAHLDYGFKKFFKHEASYPRYKSKKTLKQKVHYRNEAYAFNFDENSVRVAGFRREERISCKSHHAPLNACGFYSCTVTFDGKDYWISANTEIDTDEKILSSDKYNESIGIDVGIRKFAQVSDGTVYQHPKILNTIDKRIRKQQSKLSRMHNKRREISCKAKTKLEDIPLTKNEIRLKDQNIKLRIRRKNIINSFLHQITTEIANKYPKRIVMENISVISFIGHEEKYNNKNAIYHANWYKFRELLKYKAEERNIEFVLADKNFPSSQICSNCGNIHKTSNREYICHKCGFRLDRDLNAAINLSNYYAK